MKQNSLLARMEAKLETRYRVLYAKKQESLMQLAQDAAMLAAHDVLGLGPGRAERFAAAFREYINEIAGMVQDDAKDDAEFVYAKERVDRQLCVVCGDKFDPWEKRYGGQKK